jgi:hypothetical protein
MSSPSSCMYSAAVILPTGHQQPFELTLGFVFCLQFGAVGNQLSDVIEFPVPRRLVKLAEAIILHGRPR